MKASGFTLLEVLLSLVLMGISFAVLAQGMGGASHGTATSQNRTRAVLLASRKMVEVETGALDVTQEDQSGTFADPDDAFSYQVSATPLSQPTLYDVSITVSWEDRSVVLHRLINTSLRQGP